MNITTGQEVFALKKLLCLALALLMCTLALPALALTIPTSTSSLPDMLFMPDCPEIIRVQKDGASATVTLDRPLPSESQVLAWILDADYTHYWVDGRPGEGSTYTASGLPAGAEWMGFDIAWVSGDVNAIAHYNAAGGLESVTRYDDDFNEYVFDNDGYFCEFAYADNSVRARFDTRGVLTRYGYQAFRSTTVWFTPEGDIVYAEYDDGDGGYIATWEPGYGWYVNTAAGRVKVKLDVNPWNAKPLLPKEEEDEEEPEIVRYPNNTICLAGLSLKEADASLPDKWYNVIPVDLTHDGRQTFFLTISNARFIGECYVDVWGDEVTVSYSLIENSAIEPKSSYGRWFTSLNQITEDSIESGANGFTFGEPLSISRDLDDADAALLFIRSKASYYLPFRDGTELPRYWRNTPEWKEFRQGLQELMPYVEK